MNSKSDISPKSICFDEFVCVGPRGGGVGRWEERPERGGVPRRPQRHGEQTHKPSDTHETQSRPPTHPVLTVNPHPCKHPARSSSHPHGPRQAPEVITRCVAAGRRSPLDVSSRPWSLPVSRANLRRFTRRSRRWDHSRSHALRDLDRTLSGSRRRRVCWTPTYYRHSRAVPPPAVKGPAAFRGDSHGVGPISRSTCTRPLIRGVQLQRITEWWYSQAMAHDAQSDRGDRPGSPLPWRLLRPKLIDNSWILIKVARWGCPFVGFGRIVRPLRPLAGPVWAWGML